MYMDASHHFHPSQNPHAFWQSRLEQARILCQYSSVLSNGKVNSPIISPSAQPQPDTVDNMRWVPEQVFEQETL